MIRRVLIVDDEPLARERVAGMVTLAAPSAQVREATDGDAALELLRGWKPDAMFLDVQMPGCDGFGVLSAIGPALMPPTVFVTAFDRHAIRAFDVAAVDYLLKPFDQKRFGGAWRRLEAQHGSRVLIGEAKRLSALLAAVGSDAGNQDRGALSEPQWIDRLVVKKDERTVVVKLAEVEWIESARNYSVLHAGRETHTVREAISTLESRLDPRQFVRIHRRIIVALDAMKELQPWFGGDQVMILKNGQQLRVSRAFREQLASRLAGTG